jgi:hypothetical protein
MPRPKTLVHLQIRINNILRAAAGRLTKPPENIFELATCVWPWC